MGIELRIKSAILDLMATSEEPLTEWQKIEVRAFYLGHPEMLED